MPNSSLGVVDKTVRKAAPPPSSGVFTPTPSSTAYPGPRGELTPSTFHTLSHDSLLTQEGHTPLARDPASLFLKGGLRAAGVVTKALFAVEGPPLEVACRSEHKRKLSHAGTAHGPSF